MGQTVHETALETKVRSVMSGPDAMIYVNYLQLMNQGFYPEIDFAFQNRLDRNASYTLEEAYAWAQIHTQIAMGKIAICDLTIDETPSANALLEANKNKLANGLRGLESEYGDSVEFDCDVYCELADQDGWLKWSPYLVFGVSEYDVNSDSYVRKFVKLNGDMGLPVEIGTTSAARTLSHLGLSGGVVRWPYNSNVMRVFMRSDGSSGLQRYRVWEPRHS